MSTANVTTPAPVTPDEQQTISFAIGALVLGIVFLLGVPGNLFIIWSILARARKRSVTTLIILNLAIADGGIMCLTVFFVIYLAKQSWVFGRVMCKLLFYLCNMNMYASIMLITLMSLHRLVAVLWPHRAHVFARRRFKLGTLTAVWVLVFVLAIPALIFRDEKEEDKTRKLCSHNHTQPKYEVFHFTTETVVGFLVPYGIIVSSYLCIVLRLRQTKFKKKVRCEKLILAIIVTFAAFWLPYHVNNVMQVVAACLPETSSMKKTLQKLSNSSRPATSSLAFISSCANPVLYALAGRSYIRADGLSFMARLFEGTALEISTRTLRINRKISKAGQAMLGLKASDTCSNAAGPS